MEKEKTIGFEKKDFYFSILSGSLIGLLALPILRAAKPELYARFYLSVVPFFVIAVPFGVSISHMVSKKIPLIWQVAKFGVIGVLNTCMDLGILSLLTFIGRDNYGVRSEMAIFGAITFYSLYKSISFILANINSYYWNKYWTFEQNANKKKQTEFLQFFLVSLVGFLLNIFVASFIFKYIPHILGMNSDQWSLVGALAGTVAGLAWNFLGYKFIVFKK